MEPEEKVPEVKEKKAKKAAETENPGWAAEIRADAERRHVEHLAAVLMTGGWSAEKVASKIEAARSIAAAVLAKGE